MINIKLSIKNIKSDKLRNTAICHMSAFPGSFSSKLGIDYVKKMLEWYIVSEDRFLVGISSKDKIVGYVGGAKGYGSTSGMMQYAFWQGIRSILIKPYLLFNLALLSHSDMVIKNVLKRLFLQWKKSTFSETKIPQENKDLSVGLIVIGVHSDFIRRGIGSMLLKAFTAKSLEIGGTYGHLTVKTHNTNAIDAYTKNGWEIMKFNKTVTNMRIKIR